MRFQNWPERLAEYVESKRSEPFKWGTNDCALFAKGAVESVQIDSTVSEIQTRYRSAKGAVKWLLDNDADDLWIYVDKHFNRIPITMVKRGDLVGHLTTDKSIGVCLGEFFATPSDNGLVFASLSDAEIAWSID